MTSNQATPRFTGTPAVPHLRGQSGKRRRHKVQSGRHWVGRAGRDGAEPRSRRGVGVRWAHCGSFLREVSLPPRCQEPLAPRQERKKDRPAASREPQGGRQDVRAPDPAGVRGRGPRGLPRAAPLPRQRLALAPGSGPAPPARARPRRLQSAGRRGAQASARGWRRRPEAGGPAGRPSLLGLLSRDSAPARGRGSPSAR